MGNWSNWIWFFSRGKRCQEFKIKYICHTYRCIHLFACNLIHIRIVYQFLWLTQHIFYRTFFLNKNCNHLIWHPFENLVIIFLLRCISIKICRIEVVFTRPIFNFNMHSQLHVHSSRFQYHYTWFILERLRIL